MNGEEEMRSRWKEYFDVLNVRESVSGGRKRGNLMVLVRRVF